MSLGWVANRRGRRFVPHKLELVNEPPSGSRDSPNDGSETLGGHRSASRSMYATTPSTGVDILGCFADVVVQLQQCIATISSGINIQRIKLLRVLF